MVKEMPLRMRQTRTQSGERESKFGLFRSDQSTGGQGPFSSRRFENNLE
jgi:hypothetical protein